MHVFGFCILHVQMHVHPQLITNSHPSGLGQHTPAHFCGVDWDGVLAIQSASLKVRAHTGMLLGFVNSLSHEEVRFPILHTAGGEEMC